ncbi:MAG TPA: prolipoprotein diacylglyceryl transferase [Armatimonadota bacterium]|jgi:phosphatidylglycerol:prolipoprotein diacylglycerol transferase
MKPVLVDISHISPLACLAIFVAITLGIGMWMLVMHRRGALTRDHLITAGVAALMAAIFLFIIYRIGAFTIKSYGLMLMLGFVVGIYTGTRLGRRRGVPTERLLDLGLIILVSAVVGARLLYWIMNGGPLFDVHAVMREGVGGLSFHGGLLAGIAAALIYTHYTKLRFWRVADCFAPGLAVGYAITRIGCFLNGCCYGTHTELPWAATFLHSPDGIVRDVHPTQIYASLMGFAMYAILLLLARGNSLGRAGRVFMAFLMLEGVERFTMEIFRQRAPYDVGFFSLAQVVSIVLLLAGIVGWYLLPKRAAVDVPSVTTKSPAAAHAK